MTLLFFVFNAKYINDMSQTERTRLEMVHNPVHDLTLADAQSPSCIRDYLCRSGAD